MSKKIKKVEGNLPKAIYGSDKTPLKLGEVEIPCYVLEDGTRVLSRNGIQKAIGYAGTSGDMLTNFITPKNGFSTEISAGILKPIVFERPSAGGSVPTTYGYEAASLIDICNEIIDLSRAGKLTPQQEVYARYADIIVRAVAKVGIIALVDEATGYQYDRERNELQKILKAYISDELLKWQKTFPDTFYQEIFRLNGWDYTVQNIKRKPGVVGTWTNKVIYEQLPKGVLEELKKKTPKSAAGNKTARYFQSLTADTGHPHLTAQLNQIIAIMRISDNWQDFIANFNKMVARKNGQLEIGYEELKPPAEAPQKQLSDFNQKLTTALNYNPKDKDQ